MALPLRVKNALRLGYARAAPIPSQLPEGRAWVYIRPIMKSGKTYQQVLQKWTNARSASDPYDETIEFYEVRLLDLTSWDSETDLDYEADRTAEARAIRDESRKCVDEVELEIWLNKYLADLNQLTTPDSADYWFE